MGLGYVSLGLGMVVGATMPGMAPIWIALGAAFCAMSAGWYHRHYGFVRARRDRASHVLTVTGAARIIIGMTDHLRLTRLMAPLSTDQRTDEATSDLR